jgi:hypothetical protein
VSAAEDVVGLERFRQAFAAFAERYVIIGGVACAIAYEQFGLAFRSTRDVDLVLCLERLDDSFQRALWDFIAAAGYRSQGMDASRCGYRFARPAEADYPAMIEIFCRQPDGLELAPGQQHVPIPHGDDLSQLSAILLAGDYYGWIHRHRTTVTGLSVESVAGLIPLKVRAFLDLQERRATGTDVDRRKVSKQRSDVFRLLQLLPQREVPTPGSLVTDVERFCLEVAADPPDIRALQLGDLTVDAAVAQLRATYRNDDSGVLRARDAPKQINGG